MSDRRIVQFVLFLNAILGVIVSSNAQLYLRYGQVFFGLGCLGLLAALWHWRGNLLFQSRLLLLATIGYYAGFVKVIDPSAAFSPVGIDAQTLEVGAQMFGLTSIALLGAFLGLASGFGRPSKHDEGRFPGTAAAIPWVSEYFVVAAVMVLITGYMSAKSYGDSVFESSYASGSGEGQLLGNLQAIGIVAMVLAITAALRLRNKWVMPLVVFLGFYYFVWGILIRGGRTEVLSGMLAVFVAVYAASGRVAAFKGWHYIAVVGLAVFMEAWGALRSTLSAADAPEETIIQGYLRLMELGIYHAGTVSGIATTFSNTVHMITHSVVSFDLGGSYLDYVLRTPPEFMYPGRPKDLAWMFQDYGYVAIGGMFELAEAYFNFGMLGCFVVPFFVSYFIAFSYRKALEASLFWFFVLAAVMANTFRGGWYQTFAYYKGVVTGIVLYVLFVFAGDLLARREGRSPAIWSSGRSKSAVG